MSDMIDFPVLLDHCDHDVVVTLSVFVDLGSPGSYYDPPESPEVQTQEFVSVEVDGVEVPFTADGETVTIQIDGESVSFTILDDDIEDDVLEFAVQKMHDDLAAWQESRGEEMM